ncbi:MAG: Crp/Fnr family transcriptional regulator [Myxococcota bacterium]
MGAGQANSQTGDENTGFVVRRAFERQFAAGETIYDIGSAGDGLFVIQAGQVELQRESADGVRPLARFGPGELFGEMGVLLGRARATRAVAVSDARLLELDRPTFEAMCVERPEIAIRVIQRLAARLKDLEQRLAALGVDDLLRPIIRVLVRHAEPGANDATIATSLRAVAAEAGLTLIEAHRGLGQLLERKLVRLLDDSLVIPDLEGLSAALD